MPYLELIGQLIVHTNENKYGNLSCTFQGSFSLNAFADPKLSQSLHCIIHRN